MQIYQLLVLASVWTFDPSNSTWVSSRLQLFHFVCANKHVYLLTTLKDTYYASFYKI